MSAADDSLAKLAAQAREDGRWPDAVKLYAALLKADPANADNICWHAYALWQGGDRKGAMAEYQRAENFQPTWSGINNCLGSIHRELGKPEDAIAQYQLALKKEPYYADAHANLASLLWSMGRLGEAASHYRRAIASRPDWAEIYDDLAHVLDDQGLYAEANMAARESIRLSPGRPASHITLAIIQSHMDQHDDADATMQTLIKEAPEDASLRSRLSWIRWRAKRNPEAAEAAREALARDAAISYPHFLLGWIAADKGERENAIGHYRKYLELDPSDTEGAALALAHLGAGEAPDRASESYMRQLYATRSSSWDTNVDNQTQYRAPQQIADALARFMGAQKNLDIMDAGCGTGLTGPLVRERAKVLDGLDLSSYMLEKAREKDVYDELIEGDLEQVLYARREQYDVIASAATLIHFGDLTAPLAACAAALKPGGWMAFTVFPNQEGIGVLPFFCHSHSPAHIRDRAEGAGFDVVSIEEHIHEYQHGKAIPGLVVVLRKRRVAA